MNVILATKIEGLGCEADLVTVKAGYGRNYLIPQGLAFEATPANQRFINMLQKKRAEREAAELANFQEIAAKIAAVTVNLTLEAGENGKVFGAITNQQIAEGLPLRASKSTATLLSWRSRSRSPAPTRWLPSCTPR